MNKKQILRIIYNIYMLLLFIEILYCYMLVKVKLIINLYLF